MSRTAIVNPPATSLPPPGSRQQHRFPCEPNEASEACAARASAYFQTNIKPFADEVQGGGIFGADGAMIISYTRSNATPAPAGPAGVRLTWFPDKDVEKSLADAVAELRMLGTNVTSSPGGPGSFTLEIRCPR